MNTPAAGPARPARFLVAPRRALALLALAAAVLLAGCAGPETGSTSEPPPAATTHEEPAPDTDEDPDEDSGQPTLDRDGATGTQQHLEPEEIQEAGPAVLGEGVPPAHLQVPAIDIDEELIDLGFQPDGAMEVPTDWDRAGWFTGGGMPGGAGPTVIAGHVDSHTGPAVFFRLTELEVGEAIEVTDAEGTVHHYEVYEVADLPKDVFPTARVFGALASDELRLVTCTGEFDPVLARHADNRVVFAHRINV